MGASSRVFDGPPSCLSDPCFEDAKSFSIVGIVVEAAKTFFCRGHHFSEIFEYIVINTI